MPQLTTDMILVMSMIGVAVFLFIVEWVRVDVVAILMMVALPLLHLVTPKEAFSGLSSNAVISIIAVIIIGAGLDRTGIINRLVGPILRLAGNGASRASWCSSRSPWPSSPALCRTSGRRPCSCPPSSA